MLNSVSYIFCSLVQSLKNFVVCSLSLSTDTVWREAGKLSEQFPISSQTWPVWLQDLLSRSSSGRNTSLGDFGAFATFTIASASAKVPDSTIKSPVTSAPIAIL
jgi:hypothetical protein